MITNKVNQTNVDGSQVTTDVIYSLPHKDGMLLLKNGVGSAASAVGSQVSLGMIGTRHGVSFDQSRNRILEIEPQSSPLDLGNKSRNKDPAGLKNIPEITLNPLEEQDEEFPKESIQQSNVCSKKSQANKEQNQPSRFADEIKTKATKLSSKQMTRHRRIEEESNSSWSDDGVIRSRPQNYRQNFDKDRAQIEIHINDIDINSELNKNFPELKYVNSVEHKKLVRDNTPEATPEKCMFLKQHSLTLDRFPQRAAEPLGRVNPERMSSWESDGSNPVVMSFEQARAEFLKHRQEQGLTTSSVLSDKKLRAKESKKNAKDKINNVTQIQMSPSSMKKVELATNRKHSFGNTAVLAVSAAFFVFGVAALAGCIAWSVVTFKMLPRAASLTQTNLTVAGNLNKRRVRYDSKYNYISIEECKYNFSRINVRWTVHLLPDTRLDAQCLVRVTFKGSELIKLHPFVMLPDRNSFGYIRNFQEHHLANTFVLVLWPLNWSSGRLADPAYVLADHKPGAKTELQCSTQYKPPSKFTESIELQELMRGLEQYCGAVNSFIQLTNQTASNGRTAADEMSAAELNYIN